MSTMEIVYDGKVQKIGKNTAVVRIPADIADLLEARPGSRVVMSKEGSRLILEFPKDSAEVF